MSAQLRPRRTRRTPSKVYHTTSKEIPKICLNKVKAGITAAAKQWNVKLLRQIQVRGILFHPIRQPPN
jgi:hypothetical protein